MDGKVLVVDDEESPKMVLRLELLDAGFSVQVASDGDEAIAAIEKEKFDLVLLDIKMPRVNGFEVLKFIKEKYGDTRVIMMTSFADLKSATESERLGAEGFLIKPYELSVLMKTIDRVLKEPPGKGHPHTSP
jgi:DNA-binding NtrC family response regulator